MTNQQGFCRRRLMAVAALLCVLALGGCSGWFGPDAAAEDKANSSGGALGTGMGTIAPNKSETPSKDGAFAPPPATQP